MQNSIVYSIPKNQAVWIWIIIRILFDNLTSYNSIFYICSAYISLLHSF